jgi:hypothetical protein
MKAKQNAPRPVNLQASYNIWDAKAWLSQGMTLTDVPPMIVRVLQEEFGDRLHDEFIYEDGRYYRKISLAPLPPNPEYTKPTARDITSEVDTDKLRRDIEFDAGACGFGSDPTVIL